MNALYAEPECHLPYQPLPKLSAIEQLRAFREKTAGSKAFTKPKQPQRDVSSINRCNTQEVRQFNYLLPQSQQTQIQSIRKKQELYPQRYSDPNYLKQSQMLLMSPGWSSAMRYSCCSIITSVNPSGQCRLHRFCPYCSYLTGRDLQLQLVPAYNQGHWHFMTGSYQGALGMSMSSDAYVFLDHWNLYRNVLTNLFLKDSIRGFYMIEELGVNSIHQISVLPHIHALIDADHISAQDIHELAEQAAQKTEVQQLQPNVLVEPIESQRCLMDKIRYLHKPINFVKAYENDWNGKCVQSSQDAQILNSHTTDLILGYSLVNRKRNKMTAKGTLNSRCGKYIGKTAKEMRKYKNLLRQLQQEANESYIEQPDNCDEDIIQQ